MALAEELTAGEFADLHPSARLVYAVLRSDGPKTRTELAEATGISVDHVSTVLRDLKERDIAGEQPAPRGAQAHRQFYATPPKAANSTS